MPSASSGTEFRRVSRFGVVGILNTLLDFGIYNVLTAQAGWSVLPANAVSTTIAMLFSFFANRHLVFKGHSSSAWRQAALFFATTAFGLYVLQLGVLHLLTAVWLGPVNVAVSFAHGLGLRSVLSDSFVRNNSAKVAATVVSLTWNYFAYKLVVFK